MSAFDEAREYLDKANRPGPTDVALGHLISALHLILDQVEALEAHTHSYAHHGSSCPGAYWDNTGKPLFP